MVKYTLYIKKRMGNLKKKLALILFSLIFIVACGGSPEKDEQAKTNDTTEDDSGIEVDKGIFNVEVTLPPSLFEDDEFADIEAEIKEDVDADVIQNDDGSITFKMSKKDHNKLMTEMKEEFVDTIEEIVEDDDFASIKDITYNKDFTEINMLVEKEAFENSFDGFTTLTLGMVSMYYQAFNGKDIEIEKITIFVEDESTNEIINEIVYPDQLDEMEKELE